MASWIDRFLDESTVFWPPPTRDGLGGYSWAAPAQILGRWQFSVGGVSSPQGDKIFYLSQGTEILGMTSVWISQNVEVGSYLWKGSLDDLPVPDQTIEAKQVVSTKRIRSIPNKYYLYKVFLDVR